MQQHCDGIAPAWAQKSTEGNGGLIRSCPAVETGRYDPSLPLAFKLAAVFELPIESIFLPEPERAARHPAI